MSRSMWEVTRFEIDHWRRSVWTWTYLAVALIAPIWMYWAQGSTQVAIDAPRVITESTLLIAFVSVILTASLLGESATRDVRARVEPLLHTSPLGETDYLAGRFLGAFVVNVVLLIAVTLAHPLVKLVPAITESTGASQISGWTQLAAYAQPLFVFALPNAFLMATVIFAVATLTRRTLNAYAAGVLLFFVYLLIWETFPRIPGAAQIGALLDPFAMATVEYITRDWTPLQTDTKLLGFESVLFWNRLIWSGVGVGLLWLLRSRFRFGHPIERSRWLRKRRDIRSADDSREWAVAPLTSVVCHTVGPRARLRQTLAITRRSWEEIFQNRLFPLLLLALVGFAFPFGWEVGGVDLGGTTLWPRTHLVATAVLSGSLSIGVWIFTALFAGELVWRERDLGLWELSGAAPIPTWALFLGRLLALIMMVVVLQAVLMVAGLVIQVSQGYTNFEFGLYFRILFGVELIDYVLLAVLALTIHTLVNQKYVGHALILFAYAFRVVAPFVRVNEKLLVYGSDPQWLYSDLNGFGPFMTGWAWFKLYWAAWAVLLAIVASLFWMRGSNLGFRARALSARRALGRRTIGAMAAAMVLIASVGGFTYYNTHILNEFQTPRGGWAQQAEYERRYKQYEAVPLPTIVAADLRIEIYPERPFVELAGTLDLVNQTAQRVDSVHVMARDVERRSLELSREARHVLEDHDFGYHIFELEEGLAPGDSIRLTFDFTYQPRGFTNQPAQTQLVENGSYFGRNWLPIIGYQAAAELTRPDARAEVGLPPRPSRPSVDDPDALQQRWSVNDADLVAFEAVIGTAEDQVAITFGQLIREWTEGGRRYFHYRSDRPVSFAAPVVSARYEVLRDDWNGIELELYYHPDHGVNVDRILRGTKATLAYATREFGPYDNDHLRLIEVPRYHGFAGRANSHTIFYSEASSFMTRVREDDLDRPFTLAVHETAHQWFGNQVRGAFVVGEDLLTESLAAYTEMLVVEETYGAEAVRQLYADDINQYRWRRSVPEVPLLDVGDQSYLAYNKGPVALYNLKEHVGAGPVNRAIRTYLDKHRAGEPPFPTSRDLYRELQAVTPDSLQTLLSDLFEKITLWDVETHSANYAPDPDGGFWVTLDIEAQKMRGDSVRNETEVPMDDLIEIGVFADWDGASPGQPLYLQRHRIRSGRTTIRVHVTEVPDRAGIDPYAKLLQRVVRDNVARVEADSDRVGPRGV